MKKKTLYYTILTFVFIALFVIDVLILATFNMTSGFFVALGAAIVLSLFGIFKSILKERPYFKDIKGEGESCELDDGVALTNVDNVSSVEVQGNPPLNIDDDTHKLKVICDDLTEGKNTIKRDDEREKDTSIGMRFMSWNSKYYVSINTVILMVLIAFLYILPVYEGASISEYSWTSGGTSSNEFWGTKIIPFERHDLLFYNYTVFFLAAIGLIMNWGHNIVKNKRSWLYLFNIAVQVLISMMYILAYLKWNSEYWPFLFFPITCSLYICMVSNRLMKKTNQ